MASCQKGWLELYNVLAESSGGTPAAVLALFWPRVYRSGCVLTPFWPRSGHGGAFLLGATSFTTGNWDNSPMLVGTWGMYRAASHKKGRACTPLVVCNPIRPEPL